MKLTKLYNKVLFRFPTKLPNGATEFETFYKSIVQTYDFPDNDSVRFALATMILHAPESMAYAPKFWFVRRLIKGAANQVASQVFTEMKIKQKAAEDAAKAEQVRLESEKKAEADADAMCAIQIAALQETPSCGAV
jgi:hypothetical protein